MDIYCQICGNDIPKKKWKPKTCSRHCATILGHRNSDREYSTVHLNHNGRSKGSKNKNPYPMSDAVLERLEKNPPPSWAGKFHTLETKDMMSIAAVERVARIGIPVFHKGRFKPLNPSKYKGDPTNIVFRSSWEFKFMSFIDQHPDIIHWSSEELSVKYMDPTTKRVRNYFPDFIIKTAKGTTMIEIKPKAQTQPSKSPKHTKRFIKESMVYAKNIAKWQAAEEYCKDRKWTFKIMTETDIFGA